MLFVPYSSIYWIMFDRRPVSMDEIAMTVETPIIIPSTVRKLRNLCARKLSSAIRIVSVGTNDGNVTATSQFFVSAVIGSSFAALNAG